MVVFDLHLVAGVLQARPLYDEGLELLLEVLLLLNNSDDFHSDGLRKLVALNLRVDCDGANEGKLLGSRLKDIVDLRRCKREGKGVRTTSESVERRKERPTGTPFSKASFTHMCSVQGRLELNGLGDIFLLLILCLLGQRFHHLGTGASCPCSVYASPVAAQTSFRDEVKVGQSRQASENSLIWKSIRNLEMIANDHDLIRTR